MSSNLKVKDSGKDISVGSRLDRYWKREGFTSWYHRLRTPKPKLKGSESIEQLYELLISEYGFRGLEFGNWVNNETRFNYLVSAIVALEDIQRIVKFKNSNVGQHKLGLAFGARGAGSAKGHFEPGSFIINLTRYGRDERFDSGGVGALAHEYGHFLDYFFGTFIDKNWQYRSLTKGRTVARSFEAKELDERTLHGMACKIVQTMIWFDEGKNVLTEYYAGLIRKFGDNEYWFRHNELFARAFEQYIFRKLKSAGISNHFLTDFKYDGKAYPDERLAAKLAVKFDKLLSMMRTKGK